MKINFFLRELNSETYVEITKDVDVLPRIDETISFNVEKTKKYFQVVGVHHANDPTAIEVYAVLTKPAWDLKKSGAIGFNFR